MSEKKNTLHPIKCSEPGDSQSPLERRWAASLVSGRSLVTAIMSKDNSPFLLFMSKQQFGDFKPKRIGPEFNFIYSCGSPGFNWLPGKFQGLGPLWSMGLVIYTDAVYITARCGLGGEAECFPRLPAPQSPQATCPDWEATGGKGIQEEVALGSGSSCESLQTWFPPGAAII